MNQQTSEHDDDVAIVDVVGLFEHDPITEGLCQFVAGVESIAAEIQHEGGMTREVAERLNEAVGETVADPTDYPESFPIQDNVQPALESAFKKAWAKIKEMWDRFSRWCVRMLNALANWTNKLINSRNMDKMTKENIAAAKVGLAELADIITQVGTRPDLKELMDTGKLSFDNTLLETAEVDPKGVELVPFIPPNGSSVTTVNNRIKQLFRDYSPIRVGMREGEELKTYLDKVSDEICKVIGDNYPGFKNNSTDDFIRIVNENYGKVMAYPAKGDSWIALVTSNTAGSVSSVLERVKDAKAALDASPTFAASTLSYQLVPAEIEPYVNKPWSKVSIEDHPGAAAVCAHISRLTHALSRAGAIVARAVAYNIRGATYVYGMANRFRSNMRAIEKGLGDDEVLLGKIKTFALRYKR